MCETDMSCPDPCIASTLYGSETHRRHPCSKLGKVGGTFALGSAYGQKVP